MEKEKLFPGLFLEYGVIFKFEEMIFFVGVAMPELKYGRVESDETMEVIVPFYMIPMIPPNLMKGVFPAFSEEESVFEDILESGKKLLFGEESTREENIEEIISLGGEIIEMI